MLTMRYRRRPVAKASKRPHGRPIHNTQLSSAAIQIAQGPSAVLLTPDTKCTANGKQFVLLSHRCISDWSAITYNYCVEKKEDVVPYMDGMAAQQGVRAERSQLYRTDNCGVNQRWRRTPGQRVQYRTFAKGRFVSESPWRQVAVLRRSRPFPAVTSAQRQRYAPHG